MSEVKNDDNATAHMEDVDDDEKVQTRVDLVDKDIQKYMASEAIYIDDETSKSLRRKIDKRVLPIMIITYFLQALDKGTISFASIMGIQEDTNLKGQQYSWLTTCTYLAVLIWEYPTNWIIQKVPIGKYLALNIIAWGISLACHAACKNFTGLVVVRTLLGIFETCCQPIFVVLSAMWYKREEQAATVSYWYLMNGGQQIVGGILAYCFTLITGGALKNWQILFLVYGLVSVLWGVFVAWYMPDSPMRAKCWPENDKMLMVERVRENQTGLQNKEFKKSHVYEALTDPQTWAYAFVQFFTALPTSGLGAFANIIISSFGFTVLQTQLLSMVLGAYLVVLLLSSAWLSRRFNQNCFTMIGYVVPSVIGTIVLMTYENDGSTKARAVLLFCYYLTLSFWGCATLGLALLTGNVGGQTKKSVAISMNFIGWAVGNTVGPQVFRSKDAPRYLTAFATHMGCYGLLIIMLIGLRVWLTVQNKKKENCEQDGSLSHAFEDLTDRENPNLRYIY